MVATGGALFVKPWCYNHAF